MQFYSTKNFWYKFFEKKDLNQSCLMYKGPVIHYPMNLRSLRANMIFLDKKIKFWKGKNYDFKSQVLRNCDLLYYWLIRVFLSKWRNHLLYNLPELCTAAGVYTEKSDIYNLINISYILTGKKYFS